MSTKAATVLLAVALGAIVVLVSYIIAGKTKDPDVAAGVQVVCYSDDGKPLFPPQYAAKGELTSDGVEMTYKNGTRAHARARSCIVAEVTAEDLAAVAAKNAPPVAAPPVPVHPGPTVPEIDKATAPYQGEFDKVTHGGKTK